MAQRFDRPTFWCETNSREPQIRCYVKTLSLETKGHVDDSARPRPLGELGHSAAILQAIFCISQLSSEKPVVVESRHIRSNMQATNPLQRPGRYSVRKMDRQPAITGPGRHHFVPYSVSIQPATTRSSRHRLVLCPVSGLE